MKHTKQIRKMSVPEGKNPLFLHYKEVGPPHVRRAATFTLCAAAHPGRTRWYVSRIQHAEAGVLKAPCA